MKAQNPIEVGKFIQNEIQPCLVGWTDGEDIQSVAMFEDAQEANHFVRARNQSDALDKLRQHILTMADDAYLVGHPEWIEIVEEARSIEDTK